MYRTLILAVIASSLLISACAESVPDRNGPPKGTTDGDTDADTDADTDTDTDADTDSDTDTDADTDADVPQYYFIAGDWHGYGEANTGEVEGTISPLTGGFTSGEKEVCVNGVLAEDYSSLGTLTMWVNQEEGSDTGDVWTPGEEYNGVYVTVTKNIDTGIRFVLEGSDGNSYCADNVAPGGTLLRWNRFRTECWGSDGTIYTPSTGFDKIQVYAPGDANEAVDFDYCVSELYPLSAEDDTDTGPGTLEMFVGNITTFGNVRADFMQYWDQITPENEGKWGSVEGSRDNYNWGGLDRAYNFAKDNNIPFKQHTFVWGSQRPSWIDGLSSSEQAEEIEEWIRDYCTRYPDTDLIDVVNESTPGHAPAEYAANAFGGDWIIRSFELSKQYCPNAIHILNDYNVLSWNTNEFIQMATPAVSAGVVDALGLQSHGLADWSLNEIEGKLNQIAALGLPIYISEYDADVADDQRQLQVMREQFTLFYNHPSVAGITLWGYLVNGTWVENSGLIHEDGSFRPAMTWLMDYLGRWSVSINP